MECCLGCMQISKEAGQPTLDPEAARKLEEEAEERRLAELRSHGTMVSPQTFAEWKKRFDAEMALSRAKLTADGIDRRSKGLSGKQFFRQLEADNLQVKLQCSIVQQHLLLPLSSCASLAICGHI